jgi:hypothetical protein
MDPMENGFERRLRESVRESIALGYNPCPGSLRGNPGGYLRQKHISGDPINSFVLAPWAILGDLTILNESGTLTYDHRIFETGGSGNPILPDEVRFEGPGGQARWTGATPVGVTPRTPVVVPFVSSEAIS